MGYVFFSFLFSAAKTMNDIIIKPQNDNIKSFKSKLKFFVELTVKDSNFVKIIKVAIIPKPIMPPLKELYIPASGL